MRGSNDQNTFENIRQGHYVKRSYAELCEIKLGKK